MPADSPEPETSFRWYTRDERQPPRERLLAVHHNDRGTDGYAVGYLVDSDFRILGGDYIPASSILRWIALPNLPIV